MGASGGLNQSILMLSKIGSKKDRKRNMSIPYIFWWLIWKEKNKRIFENYARSTQQLATSILEEIKLQLMVYSLP
jgi:hypothetical protein